MTAEQLIQRRVEIETDIEVATARVDEIAAGETQALASDRFYTAWTRQKKLADLDLARAQNALKDIVDEIEAAHGRAERDAVRRKYDAVKMRNINARKRLVAFRETVLPEILELLRVLAQDAVDCEAINRVVPRGEGIAPADGAVRDRPSDAEQVVIDEIVHRWCDDRGAILSNQLSVAVGPDGKGSISADFGQRRIPCSKRKFRLVEKLAFQPAHDAVPLWKSWIIPRFDRLNADVFDGREAYIPDQALQQLAADRREHPRDRTVELIPIDANGRELSSRPAFDLGPEVS